MGDVCGETLLDLQSRQSITVSDYYVGVSHLCHNRNELSLDASLVGGFTIIFLHKSRAMVKLLNVKEI